MPRWNRAGSIDSNIETTKRSALIKELNLSSAETEYFNGFPKLLFYGEVLKKKILNRQYCPVGDVAFNISYKGDVLGCFQDFGHENNYGHIDDGPIKTMVREQYKRLGKMKICARCDVKKAVDFKGLSQSGDDFYNSDSLGNKKSIKSCNVQR